MPARASCHVRKRRELRRCVITLCRMLPDHETCFRALSARDARFDGLFFVGVATTGIYCRPVCPARTPGRSRCRFFSCAAAAEHHGFRPCLRCRPELAPGLAPIDTGRSIARSAARRIESGALSQGGTVDQLAEELGMSARQLRRVMATELGATPIQLAQTHRLLLAKQLLTETDLPMIDVAHASGFESVRRFNVLFRERYGLTPSGMRRTTPETRDGSSIELSIAYRPPYAWKEFLGFLQPRLISGVEAIVDDSYLRSIRLDEHSGWFRVRHDDSRQRLRVEISVELLPVLSPLLTRVRHLFDIDARPHMISTHLQQDALLAPLVRQHPGLRVPGTVDEVELCVRAILGQQVSVKSASTLAGRLAAKLGQPISTPWPQINRLTPFAERLARMRSTTLTRLGILKSRADTIRRLARAIHDESLCLSDSHPAETLEQLLELPGIGPWTAQYVAMRALPWPDAFPDCDLVLRQAAGSVSARQLRQMAETWRPWRAYAAMHLWQSRTTSSTSN